MGSVLTPPLRFKSVKNCTVRPGGTVPGIGVPVEGPVIIAVPFTKRTIWNQLAFTEPLKAIVALTGVGVPTGDGVGVGVLTGVGVGMTPVGFDDAPDELPPPPHEASATAVRNAAAPK